jgi:hypothetical protein
MSFHAANSAGFSYLFWCPVEWANKSLSTRNNGGELHSSCRGHCLSNRTAMSVDFRSQCTDENFALERVCRYVSRLLLGHSFGVFPAPVGTRSSASHSAPLWGHGSSQNKFENHGKERPQTSFGPLPESRPSALGSRAHSLSSAQCDPSNNGQFQQTETLSCTRTK